MLELDKEVFGENSPFGFLRSCFMHFTKHGSIQAIQAKMYGATISDLQHPALTHVVVPKETEMQDIQTLKKSTKAKVVSEDWLEQCLLLQKYISEMDFVL